MRRGVPTPCWAEAFAGPVQLVWKCDDRALPQVVETCSRVAINSLKS